MSRAPRLFLLAAALATAGCGSSGGAGPRDAAADGGGLADASSDAARDGSTPDATPEDAGRADAGTRVDAGHADAAARDASAPDASNPDAAAPDAAREDAGPADGGATDAAAADAGAPDGSVPTYRSSLSICWTDATCRRKLAIAHGGLWNAVSAPYDSNAALTEAFDRGMDGVKIDVRVTMDDVPVIAHSSPIQIYESLDCVNRRIEQMTAAQVTQCHRLPSRTETFQRLDDVLDYLRGKMVAQLTVKRPEDYQRTIQEVLADGAEDYAFLEIETAELQTLVPTLTGGDRIYYLINIGSAYGEVDTLLDTIRNPRAFMYELDPSATISSLVTTRLHPAGIRAFTYDDSSTAGVRELQALYDQGFDVVSAQTAANLQARINANTAQGVSPP